MQLKATVQSMHINLKLKEVTDQLNIQMGANLIFFVFVIS